MTVKEYHENPYAQFSRKVATAESGNNPKARNPYGSASGLHQFTAQTWQGVTKKYGLNYSLDDRFDPKKSEKVFELFTRDNASIIEPVLGHTPNDADLYMSHFLGAGGASNFFKTYQQDPNASIASVMSPAAINANKGVVYDKGRLKTVSEVYQWAQNKMNITPSSVTENLIDYEVPKAIPNFTGNKVQLSSLPESEEKIEDPKVAEAKNELEQKTNEYNFIQEYLSQRNQPQQQIQQIEPQPQEQPSPNLLEQYQQISAFVENPIYQKGGTITVDSYNDPRYQAYRDSLDLSKSVMYIPYGRTLFSEDGTGDRKSIGAGELLKFNKKNAKAVIEELGLKKIDPKGKETTVYSNYYGDIEGKIPQIMPIDYADSFHNKVDPRAPYYTQLIYPKPKQRVLVDTTPTQTAIVPREAPVVDTTPTATIIERQTPTTFKTYGYDLFQNEYRVRGEARPSTGRQNESNWDEDIQIVWLKDPAELGINRQQNYGYNVYNDTYKNAQEGVDYVINRVPRGQAPSQFQAGGEVQKEWLKYWYDNREIDNSEINDIYQRDRQNFTNRAGMIPPITTTETPDKNNSLVTALYDPTKRQILVKPNQPSSTNIHEMTHFTQNFNSEMSDVHKKLVEGNIKPKEDLPADYQEYYQYLSDPREIHARIMALRYLAGFKPDQTVESQDLEDFYEKWDGEDSNVKDLMELFDDEGVLNLLNSMAFNPTQDTVYYAQRGGEIPIDLNGVFATNGNPVIVPAPSITMKNVPYPIMGIANTGEQKIMYPGLEYYFNGAKSVLEIPLK